MGHPGQPLHAHTVLRHVHTGGGAEGQVGTACWPCRRSGRGGPGSGMVGCEVMVGGCDVCDSRVLPLVLAVYCSSADPDVLRELTRLLCALVSKLSSRQQGEVVEGGLWAKLLFVLESSLQADLLAHVRISALMQQYSAGNGGTTQ